MTAARGTEYVAGQRSRSSSRQTRRQRGQRGQPELAMQKQVDLGEQ